MKKLFLVLSIFAVLGLASCGTPLDNEAQAKDLSNAVTTGVEKAIKQATWVKPDAPKGFAEDVSKLIDGDYKGTIEFTGTEGSELTGKAKGKITYNSRNTNKQNPLEGTRIIKGSASITFIDFGFVEDGVKYALNGTFKVSFNSKTNLKDLTKSEVSFYAGTPVAISLLKGTETFSYYTKFTSELEFGKLTPTTSLNVNGEKYNFKLDLKMDDFIVD